MDEVLLLQLALVLGFDIRGIVGFTTRPALFRGLGFTKHGILGNGVHGPVCVVGTHGGATRVSRLRLRICIACLSLTLLLELAFPLLHSPLLFPLSLIVVTFAIT